MPDHAAIERDARVLADALRLRDWNIDVEPEPPDDRQAMAQMTCIYGQKHGKIRVAYDWDELSSAKRHETLVHELLHCHLDRAQALLARAEEVAPAPWLSILIAQHHEAIEHAIDALANAIAPFLPSAEGD